MRSLLAGLCLAVLGSSSATAATLHRDIAYDDGSDPARRLDLRMPDGPGPFPVVILVHGGGWGSGDKAGAEKPKSGADITPWFAPLEAAGFLAVSINYRLAPAHRWPACLEDTRAAVAWTRTHIAEFGGDPARLALMGHSAGGHLALFAAIPAAGGPAPVRAVVGCAAVSDLVSDTERRGGPSASLQALFDLPAETSPETWRRLAEASPLGGLSAGYPPTLLLHGDLDKTVPIAQSRALQARLRELGVPCELHVLPGAGHRLTEWDAHDPDWARVLTDWLRSRLSPEPDATTGGVNNATPAPLTPRPPKA
jgi:acetyl esterase/lipase